RWLGIGLAGLTTPGRTLSVVNTFTRLYSVSMTVQPPFTDAAGIGDVNGDGIDDFALLEPGKLTIEFGARGFFRDPAAGVLGSWQVTPPTGVYPTPPPARTFAGAEVRTAGDVDGDGVPDLLITGPNGGFLVFG